MPRHEVVVSWSFFLINNKTGLVGQSFISVSVVSLERNQTWKGTKVLKFPLFQK
jgi:hypothetical protein